MPDTIGSATYSPEDNKLRLYPFSRLDKETYERVKAAGFTWAAKQQLFVAPMWTPEREDLLVELCGEIEDEDKSLVERAEERADRFEGYQENRMRDANAAKSTADRIANGIPFGQPILIGHHSERHARKDAQRIENGMRKAVQMWDTASYWASRASGAIRAAKYKERPDVRARRIKTIEADMRRQKRSLEAVNKARQAWEAVASIQDPEQQRKAAVIVAGSGNECCNIRMPRKEGDRAGFNADAYTALENHYPSIYEPRTLEEVIEAATNPARWSTERIERWLNHYSHRLEYERAMLAEGGGLEAEKYDIQVGGRVLIGGEWCAVLKINKDTAGRVASVTTNARYVSVRQIEEINGYEPPTEEDAAKVKAAMKLPPICNYPGEGFRHMTKAEYEKTVPRWSDFPKVRRIKATETAGAHRVKQHIKEGGNHWETVGVFLTDQKRVDPPAPAAPVKIERIMDEAAAIAQGMKWDANTAKVEEKRAADAPFEAMRSALQSGTAVQVVAAPQLFPTPPEIARQMVEAAELKPGFRVLEPSAGTGNILRAIQDVTGGFAIRTAVEIDFRLSDRLRLSCDDVRAADFLQCGEELGQFDAVLMNPPFKNGEDIKHIEHAKKFLAPGGILVALCANGPRQQDALRGSADKWEPLPAGSFKDQGTMVNVAMMIYRKPAPDAQKPRITGWQDLGGGRQMALYE